MPVRIRQVQRGEPCIFQQGMAHLTEGQHSEAETLYVLVQSGEIDDQPRVWTILPRNEEGTRDENWAVVTLQNSLIEEDID